MCLHFGHFNCNNGTLHKDISQLDILVMLTPHSGHVDPSVDFGQKDNFMTILQFFS
jgi:hypothetical protein